MKPKAKLHDKFNTLCLTHVTDMDNAKTFEEQLRIIKDLKDKLEKLYWSYVMNYWDIYARDNSTDNMS